MFGATKYRSWLRHPGYNFGGGSDGGSENAATLAQGRMLDYNLEKLKQTDAIRDPYMAGGLQGAMSAYDKYNSPAYIDQQVGLANADTSQAIARNNAAMGRSLAQYGINPNSGRFAGMANQNALSGAALQAGAMNQTRMGLADKATTAATNKWKMLNDMQTDSMTQGNQIASGYGQQGQAIMQGAQANAQANAGMGSALMGAADLYMKYGMANGGQVSLAEARRTMGMDGNAGTPVAAGPNPAAQGLSLARRGANLYEKGSAGMARNASIEAAQGAQATAAGTGQAATGLSATGQQAGMLAAQEAGMGAAAEGATTAALAEGTTGALAAGVETAAAANAWNPVGWVLGAAALFGALAKADGGEVAKPVKAPFEQRREVFEGVFDEKYTGSKAQDDMMLAYLQGRMEAAQAGGRQDMTGGGPVAGPGTTSSDSIPAWLSDKEHVVNAEAASLPGVRPALEAINRAGLELRGQA